MDNIPLSDIQKFVNDLFQKKLDEFNKVSLSEPLISENMENNNSNKRKLRVETPISNKKLNLINSEATHALVLWVGDKIKKHSVVPISSVLTKVVEGKIFLVLFIYLFVLIIFKMANLMMFCLITKHLQDKL